MGFKVAMPKFTETMEEGTIKKWYKKEGERVKKGEPLVQIIGEKLIYDMEAPASGKLLKIFRGEDSNVPVGEPIAFIGEEGEAVPVPKAVEEVPALRVTVEKMEMPAKPLIKASPLARKLAKKYGVDLTQVTGTGPGGRIIEADVRRFVEARSAIAETEVKEILPLVGVRKTVADRMTLSSTIPRITLMVEVDASEMLKLQKYYEAFENAEVSLTHIIVKAVAKALEKHPIMNSTLEGDKIKVLKNVNVGIAVATEMGLIVPVVKNADKLSLKEIAKEARELVAKAKAGTLTKAEVSGGTFTVTNLGMYGVDAFTPLINPPECAILGVGRVAEKPVVVDGKIEVRPTMTLSLSFDHRIVDGAPAALFLQTLKGILEGAFSEVGKSK